MKTLNALSELRLEMGSKLGLRDPEKYAPLWVIDFPLFEFNKADISDEKRRMINGQMLEQAMVDAKSKAEKMAKGFGAVLGRVLLIEEIRDYYAAPDYNYDYDGMYAQSMDMMVTIIARVQVQYELK